MLLYTLIVVVVVVLSRDEFALRVPGELDLNHDR